MNTKTMRLPPRRVLTPNKRKDRDDLDAVRQPPSKLSTINPLPDQPGSLNAAEIPRSNRLLAGYLAHEFLTKGTLFCDPWDPSGAQASPAETSSSSSSVAEPKPSQIVEPDSEPSEVKRQRYAEVAQLLWADGTHLPGIVNPAQLARHLKL